MLETLEVLAVRILVSACLLGVCCRYDGRGAFDDRVARLAGRYSLVPVCPEQLGGMPTPRWPSEIICGRNVVNTRGEDKSAEFAAGASEALRIARLLNCKAAVMKERSPSCGSKEIYDGTFSGRTKPGRGIAAALLIDSGIPVFDEGDTAGLEAIFDED